MANEVFINRVIQEYTQATVDPEASAKWKRPADLVLGVTQNGDSYRLPKPIMNDNEIWYLMGVNEHGYNDIAFSCNTDGGTYSVDWWNDGSDIIVYNSGVTAEYNYDFNDSRFDNIPVDDKGYKQVWIKITPTNVENNLTRLDCRKKPSWSNKNYLHYQVLEQYIKASELTLLNHCEYSYRYPILDIISLEVENKMYNLDFFLSFCYNLKKIENLKIENINILTYFMQACYSYNQPFPDGVTFSNVTNYFMHGCSSYNQPFPDSVTFSNVTNYFMNSCYSYNQPLKITFKDNMTATGSSFFGFDTDLYGLEYLRLFNWQTKFKRLDLSNTSLNAEALDILAGDAPDRTGLDAGTITIRYTPDALTYDTTLWTDKNYTVVVN